MLPFFRKLFARTSLNVALGDVQLEEPPIRGQSSHSYLIWRVKRGLDGRLFVGMKLMPDTYRGPEGSPDNYIDFDLEAAELLRDQLNRCIAEVRERQQQDSDLQHRRT